MNLPVIFLTGMGLTSNQHAHAGDALFIVTLLALCTLPLLFIKSYRGKYSLMIVFLAYYFGAFGARDLVLLLSGKPMGGPTPDAFLSGGELLILVGATCYMAGYFLISRLHSEHSAGMLSREWSPSIMLGTGLLMWAIGAYFTMSWQFGVADRYAAVTISHSFGGFMSLFRQFQPVGSLILIYVFLTSRSKMALLALIATMLVDVVLGFLGDSKEIALRAPLLYLFSAVLLRERLPVAQGIAFLLIASIAFSLFAAYRVEVHSRHESRDQALSRIDSRLSSAVGQNDSMGERLSGGFDYFSERITIKIYVEITAARAGNDVEFLHGYTLKPLLFAFIPRLILPEKHDASMTGQLFNRKFNITADRDTYISMSQLGELYWNFGWPGAIFGMMMIGAVMGAVASALRLDRIVSLPRFVLLLVTIYLLCLRFEGALASTYTIWARAAVLLLLIHLLMPKARRRAPINKP